MSTETRRPDLGGTGDPAGPGGRGVEAILESCRWQVQPALRIAVEALPESMNRIVGYHYGWLDDAGRPDQADGGKALRPALTLLSAAAVAENSDSAPALAAAVAVQLVHDFSLLHDDVMDGDETRRHRPTVWTVFGVGPAILAGDALLILAMDVLNDSRHSSAGGAIRMLSQSVQDLVEGQIADLSFERRAEVTIAECLAMAGAKTGALFGAACALGGVFAGGRPDQIARLAQFGRRLGLAFQLADDLLGIWGDPAQTGKPVNSDLRSRKKSLPVVAALTSGTAAGRELAELYRRAQPLTEAELDRAAGLVEDAGGRAWCQDQADRQLRTALEQLPAISPPGSALAELRLVAGSTARRSH